MIPQNNTNNQQNVIHSHPQVEDLEKLLLQLQTDDKVGNTGGNTDGNNNNFQPQQGFQSINQNQYSNNNTSIL